MILRCCAAGLLWLLGLPAAATALSVAGQWRSSDGLPVDSITSVAIDARGYLWLASSDGLARFDGFEFVHFNRNSRPALPANRIARLDTLASGLLLVHLDGGAFGSFSSDTGFSLIDHAHPQSIVTYGDDLWYLSREGLRHWTPGAPTRPVLSLGARALALEDAVQAEAGSPPRLILGTHAGRLYRYTPATGRLDELASVDAPVLGIAAGPDGDFAFASRHGLHRSRPEGASLMRAELNLLQDPELRLDLAWTSDGYLVNPTSSEQPHDRLSLFDGHRLRPLGDARSAGVQSTRHTRRDAQGRLWSNEGLRLRREGVVVHESSHPILDWVVDRYNQVWVATLRGGLFKLVTPSVLAVGAEPGTLADSNIYHVSREGEHGLWVGSYRGLDHYDLRSGVWTRVREERSLGVLANGEGWLIAGQSLCTIASLGDRDCSPVPGLAGSADMATLLHRDRLGGLWLGAVDGLRYRDPDGRWLGPLLPGVRAREALELDDGRLVLASADHGVFITDIARPLHTLHGLINESGGLPSNRVRALHLDAPDSLLIGTEDRGLCRLLLSSQTLRCIGVSDGLPHHSVHRIIADDQDRLWINTNDGLYVVARDDLRAHLDAPDGALNARRFGIAEGMASSEGNGGVHSAGTRSADGRIWFPTQRGLVVVRPEQVVERDFPLQATLQPIDSRHDDGRVVLPPDARVLRVRLGAIALRGADDVRLRYRIDRRNWIATRPGELTIEGLEPGRHRLQAEARYVDGDWNGPTAALELDLPPRITETRVFRALAAMGVLGLFAGLILREHNQARKLERRVDARTASLNSALRTVREQADQIRENADRRHRWYLTVSHELRTPLTTLLGPLESTRRPPTPTQLERIRASARNIRDMVEELLQLERMESDQGQHFHTERLASLLRRALEPHQASAGTRKVELSLRLDDAGMDAERIRVRAESAQLERAIGTLIGNALSHATARRADIPDWQPHVQIVLEHCASEREARIHVDDNGPGIPAEERDEVLKPFARGAAANGSGFGLGLALCQRIVHNHRGRLRITDSPLGGARLSITLPALEEVPDAERPRAADDARLLLVVDDSPDILAHLDELLGAQYRMQFAENGAEGLRIAEAELPDAILSDVSMPVMDGLEMVRRLRERADTCAIPVIFLTAYAREELQARAFAAGGDQFLSKPFRSDQLLLRLDRLFALRRDLLAQLATPPDSAPSSVRRRPSLMERFDALLEERISDPELDIDSICRDLGVSRATLYRRMERGSGATPNDLLRERRLDLAARLLRESDEQISAVAYAVGFRHLSSFTRSFTARFGCAPSMYRRSAREPAG